MNLSCMFGHSWVEGEKKVVIRSNHAWDYCIDSFTSKVCRCCKKEVEINKKRLGNSDYISATIQYLKVHNLLEKVTICPNIQGKGFLRAWEYELKNESTDAKKVIESLTTVHREAYNVGSKV